MSMRKTTQYFSGKLSKMHKSNVMDWLVHRILIHSSSDLVEETSARCPRMYYQFKTREEIERRTSLGEVVSGFTLNGDDETILIAYGDRRRSGLMNCVGISRLNRGSSKKCIGLAYVKCELDRAMDDLENVDLKTMEKHMNYYCLLLPLIDSGVFDGEYAIVYHDWDVGDENFGKALPNLCSLCFGTNAMSGIN